MYDLGQFFRRRYNKLLGAKYSPNEIYVRSTNFNRTISSALLNLSGLYASTQNESWHDNIQSERIPVHTMSIASDSLIFGLRVCINYIELFEKNISHLPEVQRIFTEYADKFTYWSQMCGRNISTMTDVLDLYDTMMIKNQHKKQYVY